MGLFGNRRPYGLTAAQQVAAGGDGMATPVPPVQHDPRNQLFGDGSVGGIATGIGKLLAFGPYTGMAQEGINRNRAASESNMAYKSTMADVAQYRALHPDPTGTMQNVAAAGLKPGTPEYQAFMQKVLMQPHYLTLGSPETGQTVIDANAPPQQDAGPPPEAVAHLRSNPALAAQFDEVFGPGSAARVMGSQ